MSRVLISSKNSRLKNAVGCTLAIILVPFALVGALIAGIFGRPIERTADEVARYIRAMLDGTILEEDSGYDYDEFSCVPIANSELESIARRACQAFELPSGPDHAALESLLAETETLATANAQQP
jgi:hypothetical protein